jgi:hypothetical protein
MTRLHGRGFSGRGALMGMCFAIVPSLALYGIAYWIWSLT